MVMYRHAEKAKQQQHYHKDSPIEGECGRSILFISKSITQVSISFFFAAIILYTATSYHYLEQQSQWSCQPVSRLISKRESYYVTALWCQHQPSWSSLSSKHCLQQ